MFANVLLTFFKYKCIKLGVQKICTDVNCLVYVGDIFCKLASKN